MLLLSWSHSLESSRFHSSSSHLSTPQAFLSAYWTQDPGQENFSSLSNISSFAYQAQAEEDNEWYVNDYDEKIVISR